MKKLLVILLLASVSGHSQCSKMVIGPYPAFRGLNSGMRIPLLFHQPPDATQTLAGNQAARYKGKKYPVIIDAHGQGEITTSYPTLATIGTGNLDDLFSNGMPQYVQFSNSAYVGKRYAAPGRTDSTQFFYVFPQVWQGYAPVAPVAVPGITYWTIKWICANYGNIIDTNRIYITGLSLGGFQCIFSLQFPEISSKVAAGIINCPGGLKVDGYQTPSYNFKNIAEDWGGFLILAHSINDPVTDKNPSTGSGAWYTQRAIDSINKYSHKTVTLSIRIYTDATHNIWDRIWNPSNKNNVYAEANGNTITHSIPFQSLLLPWSTAGRRKP